MDLGLDIPVKLFDSGMIGTAEEALGLIENLLESSTEYSIIVSDCQGKILLWNEGARRLYGYEPEEVVGKQDSSIFHTAEDLQNGMPKQILATAERDGKWEGTVARVRKNGEQFTAHVVVTPRRDGYGRLIGFLVISRDVSDEVRRIAELEAVNKCLQAEIAARKEAELKSQELLETAADAIAVMNQRGEIVLVNRQFEQMFGYQREEILGEEIEILTPERFRERNLRYRRAYLADPRTLPMGSAVYRYGIRKDGTEFPVACSLNPRETAEGLLVYCAIRDITESKDADSRIKQQVERLAALRAIDVAITSSLDFRVTLSVFLDQVTSQLGIHAANILLLRPRTQMLQYITGRGFGFTHEFRSHVHLGEDPAGRAVIERRVITIPDLRAVKTHLVDAPTVAKEHFVSYLAAPLIAKGEVQGVLEIWHRQPLNPSADWLEFLEVLSGQAAIAIDNAMLYQQLQASNAELLLSYDTTLEGWVKALDLRDKESEGHTRRVTELTTRLAYEYPLNEEQVVHIRRGALLHDIGKMAIPDSILHKAGPLTEHEFETMRQHTVYAYEWLSPIPYLSPAVDIPYCHHEKWDGSGYPRGLRGDAIPLAARLFSVVDVWDALRSDRPYRSGWPAEKVCAHIRERAGKDFDPDVVKIFLKTVKQGANGRTRNGSARRLPPAGLKEIARILKAQ